MRFVAAPIIFVVTAMILIGLAHGDLWIAFTRFGSLGNLEKAFCLIAAAAGFFAALLKD